MSNALLGVASVRDQRAAYHRIEQLERRIGAVRMRASLALDWDELRQRSSALSEQLSLEAESADQIAAAGRIRASLHQANDRLGLRALRLATAGPMTGWLDHKSTSSAAQSLARRFAADQRRGIPGLADLERQLEQVRTSIGSHASVPGHKEPPA